MLKKLDLLGEEEEGLDNTTHSSFEIAIEEVTSDIPVNRVSP